MEIKVNELSLNVNIKGEGTPIIFVHGYTTTSGFWENQLETLSSNYKVITFDLRGHGDSDKPSSVSYKFENFVEDLRSLYDTLDINSAIVAGLSMGGAIVQKFVLDYPELVRALVLVGTTAHGRGRNEAKNTTTLLKDLGIEASSIELIRKSFSNKTSKDIVEWAEREVVKTPLFAAEKAMQSLVDFDSRNQLSQINVPTLIIVGEEDKITPVEESLLLHEKIINSELNIISNSAHFPMLENPSEFNQSMLNFLTKYKL